ncbi:MAG: AAA family ATPase [Caldilineaceae bacterium]|nr:AAA family ATPase [Caldilineaceae bacterium]
MLTRLLIRNFKRFEEADIELGSPAVFIGPNNSGKTAAIQALALWEIGLKRWLGRKADRTQRSTATRRDGQPARSRGRAGSRSALAVDRLTLSASRYGGWQADHQTCSHSGSCRRGGERHGMGLRDGIQLQQRGVRSLSSCVGCHGYIG